MFTSTQSVVVSEKFANVLSTNGSAVGKTIEISVEGNTAMLTVAGVFQELENSIIRSPKIIYRIDQLQQLTDRIIQNGSGAVATFFQLMPDTDVEALGEKMES